MVGIASPTPCVYLNFPDYTTSPCFNAAFSADDTQGNSAGRLRYATILPLLHPPETPYLS